MIDFPIESRLLHAMDVTWSAAEFKHLGPWTLRLGKGGGKRVSAATCNGQTNDADIEQAELAMAAMGQPAIFMLRTQDQALDARLQALGYRLVDPVVMYAIRADELSGITTNPHDGIPGVSPLALLRELWAGGGIEQPRLNVMERTKAVKTYMINRFDHTPACVAFVALDKEVAMLHALEVAPKMRRHGMARKMMGRAAIWAIEQGAQFLSVVVTSENTPACGLYTGLGMQVVGRYHYRMK